MSFRAGSLFINIFFWFWAAMTLAGILLLAMEAARARDLTMRWNGVTGDAFATYALTAVQALEDDNRPKSQGGRKLREFLGELEKRTRIRARLMDEKDREVVQDGRAIPLQQPDWMAQRMRRLSARARRTGQTEFDPQSGMTLAARLAVSPQGRRYILVGELPKAQYGPFVPEPRTQALRLVAILGIAALVCWGLGRHLTASIVSLREATQRLATGDFSTPAALHLAGRHDELAELARDFDRMAESIQLLRQEQERLLTEQEQLVGTQRRLLGDVSHELRSPLARVSVALEMARDRAPSTTASVNDVPGRHSSLSDAHNRIEHEITQLNALIDRLLMLARLESGVLPSQKIPVNLSELVRSIASDASFEAQPKHCLVSVLACDDCVTLGSRDLLRSALENVVRNAMRFTAQGTTIEIQLRKIESHAVAEEVIAKISESSGQPEPLSAANASLENGFAMISVRDHGPGLPDSELNEVFRPFYRAGTPQSGKNSGTGLGLSITSRAVALHGGTVRATNAEGGGLQVELFLPLVKLETDTTTP